MLTRQQTVESVGERALGRGPMLRAGLEHRANGRVVERRQHLRCMTSAHLAHIFTQGYIPPIVQPRLDAPIRARDGQSSVRRRHRRR